MFPISIDWPVFWAVLLAIFAYKASIDCIAFIVFLIKKFLDR